MNKDLRRKLNAYIAERKAVITVNTADLAELLTVYDRPPDAHQRLIDAARAVVQWGSIGHDKFICSADLGRELRAALHAYDQARNPFAVFPSSNEA